ncbi:hypothetical protein [Ferrimonas marina]|uniref:Uncharacterized protein n=1 Tax=Ferrimonas marina TaxID=299255 RepID=A0A1M5UIF8_9GAMM|nr:hypothetical protein [Ferrimonas marina]SHH62795.1 hypothetical protein SAMN02745129_2589 [Ferrimonas marina]
MNLSTGTEQSCPDNPTEWQTGTLAQWCELTGRDPRISTVVFDQALSRQSMRCGRASRVENELLSWEAARPWRVRLLDLCGWRDSPEDHEHLWHAQLMFQVNWASWVHIVADHQEGDRLFDTGFLPAELVDWCKSAQPDLEIWYQMMMDELRDDNLIPPPKV